jgi:hypothetical protein
LNLDPEGDSAGDYITDDQGNVFIDYGDSLVGAVLGERFPEWQRPAAVEACPAEVLLGRIEWKNGRPHVFPLRPAP